ncbi:MAG: protein kinase, partial [Verrucomicrobiae bacterium]|nr:protein kinase [Verrucomicrobiae bacterium]
MPERYEIRGKIARGGIGAIYRAYDTVMGREVAIKRLLPLEETHLNEAQDESLKREAAALARFQHPNVVTIYAFESDADGPYVVMEMVEGETLKEAVERAALPVEDFIELTMQVLDPLVAAKELNLLHRDIKPANIMLTWLASGRFQIKVLDFGLAKFSQAPSTQTLDQTGSFLGSIDYLAPEQLELQPLDQRTDLYSLGCVLYYTLAQRPPFEVDNAPKTMQNHLSHRVTHVAEIRPDVPGPIADWLMRLIERFPADRPTDAMQALTEFQAAIRGESPAEEVIPVAIAIPDDEPVLMAVRVPETQETPPAATDPVLEEPAQTRTRTQPQLIVPKSGSAPVKGRTQPQLVVPSSKPASGPVTPKVGETAATGSNREPSAPVKPKKAATLQREERSWLREHPVMAVLGALVLVGGLAFLLNLGGKPEKGKADPSEPPNAAAQVSANSSTGSRNSSKPSAPPMPELKNPALPKRV